MGLGVDVEMDGTLTNSEIFESQSALREILASSLPTKSRSISTSVMGVMADDRSGIEFGSAVEKDVDGTIEQVGLISSTWMAPKAEVEVASAVEVGEDGTIKQFGLI